MLITDSCSKYFKYSDFILCGDTVISQNIENLPKQEQSWIAISELAKYLMDPIKQKFGNLKLTYGFCSHNLSLNIKKAINPQRDQHSSFEVNSLGKRLCDRGGAACDFYIPNTSSREVANWIVTNLPFDRLYFYGDNKPIHLSYGPEHNRQIITMSEGPSGKLIPKIVRINNFK